MHHFYQLFGATYMVGQLASVIVATGSMILIYLILLKRYNFKVACIGSMLFVVFPSYIFYSVLLGTETLFMLLLLLIIYLAMFINENMRFINNLDIYFIVVIFLGVSNFIRPMSILILLALSIMSPFIFRSKKERLLKTISSAFTLLITMTITTSLLTVSMEKVMGTKFAKSAFGYSLYIGSNIKTTGSLGSNRCSIS
jgi:hypothetical protein